MTNVVELSSNETNPTSHQLRCARAIIGMNQEQISIQAGISAKTLISVEARKCTRSSLFAVITAYRRMGVTFEASSDYSIQSVTRHFSEPQVEPVIPSD